MQSDTLNAFVADADKPVANADQGPLSGATLAVKDIFDVEGYPTGCGNPQKLADAQPAAQTAPAVKALLGAGARFVGKTQTDELAFSLTGDNVHYPQPVNPRAPGRVTGGSSSGSAAAVSGGLADIATGSDTGGSIRAPASYCGLVGLRTTHGRISLAGTMPLAPSFDTFGWFARDGALYEAVANVLLGEDGDRTPLTRPIRLPVLENLIDVEAAQAYSDARIFVERQTRTPIVVENFGHDTDDLYWCFRNLQAEEAWQCHRDWLSAEDRKLGPGTRQRLEFGKSVSNETVASETGRRDAFRSDLGEVIGSDGYIIMPTVPGPAPLRAASFDEQQAYRERALRLLCLSGLAGFPQITLPLAEVDGAPFGLSLLGPPGRDRALISLGRMILKAAARDG
ncbi:MAG: amidase [Rhizobiaceae bacterium]